MQRELAPGLAADLRLVLGDFVLDLERGELLDALGHPAALRAQALRVLVALGQRAGQVVSKDELLRRVWGDVIVTEDSLVQAIGDIRRVLGAAGHELLRTVPRRGYLLNAAPAGEAARSAGPRPATTVGECDPPAAPASATAPAATPPAGRAKRRIRVWIAAGIAAVAALMMLATLLPGEAPPSIRSFAILPFEPADPSAADAWFADAVTADLNTMVARWRAGIHVIGRGTMQAYKGKAADPRDVGRELGVAHVLSGRVRRDGDRVRIAVELVDTASARVLWARPFEVERGELPGLVGDIAGGIAKALFIEIGDVVTRDLQPLDPAQADADDLAMRGFSVLLKSVGPESFEQSRQLFEQALARDPNSLRALGGVSLTNSMNVSFAYTTDKEGSMLRSRQALERLEAIDPTGHLTLVSRASYRLSSSDWAGQFAVSEELIRHFPNDPTSYHHRCSSLMRLGRFDEAIPACDRAIRISPQESRTPIWHGLAGMNEFMRGNYAAAAERARIPTTANPKLYFYPLLLAAALAHDGRRDEARQVVAEFRQRYPGFDGQRATAAWSSLNADPKFVEGRDRIVATARELGLP
jgi:TolB-like protein/DNA-binding winged helix-turn-helix (wHTH) protein